MPENPSSSYYETPILQKFTGLTLRPGGLELTYRALEFCDFAPGCAILDIGCGLGATQRLLQEYGFRTCGIDISRLQLKQSQSVSFSRIQANGETVPLAGNSFDGIFLECTLSVVLNPNKVLSEICRLLKPGGLLILTDIYGRNIYGIPPLRAVLSHGCFNSVWSQSEINTMIQSIGLDSILWEDHSEAIRNLTGKIILDHGSMDMFWKNQSSLRDNTMCDPLSFQLLLSRAKIGYFLHIAQKPD
jgi:SAM-dependent methyltransferase